MWPPPSHFLKDSENCWPGTLKSAHLRSWVGKSCILSSGGFFLSPPPHDVSHRNTGFMTRTSWTTVDGNSGSLEQCWPAFIIKHSTTLWLHALLLAWASYTSPPRYHLSFWRAISTHQFKKLFHHLKRWNTACKQPSRKMASRVIKQCETRSHLCNEGDRSTQGR